MSTELHGLRSLPKTGKGLELRLVCFCVFGDVLNWMIFFSGMCIKINLEIVGWCNSYGAWCTVNHVPLKKKSSLWGCRRYVAPFSFASWEEWSNVQLGLDHVANRLSVCLDQKEGTVFRTHKHGMCFFLGWGFSAQDWQGFSIWCFSKLMFCPDRISETRWNWRHPILILRFFRKPGWYCACAL